MNMLKGRNLQAQYYHLRGRSNIMQMGTECKGIDSDCTLDLLREGKSMRAIHLLQRNS
ncbi:hypothetical protein C5167_020078, partial [Papaver somniferum]